MVLKGYVGKDELYEIVNDKLLSLGITEDCYPLDPFEIAKAYKDKLQIEVKPFPTLLLGGLLYKDPDDVMSIMAINSLKSKKSQNFDVMHELLHYWLHPAGEHLCYDSNFIFQNKGIEWQANEGTAQALMPEKLFMKMYIYYSGNINNLSDYFIVSKTAVEYRIKNLKLFPPSKLRGLLYKTKKARHCTICGNLEINMAIITARYAAMTFSFLVLAISGQFIPRALTMKTAVLNVNCYWIKMQDTADAAELPPHYFIY